MIAKAILSIILLFSTSCWAVDVTIAWDASVGATGYKLRMSVDGGHRWDVERDTGSTDTTYTWVGAPEDRLLFFKVAAYNATDVKYNNYGGCWYDYRLKNTTAVPVIGVSSAEGAVKWDIVSDATNYYMEYSTNKGSTYPTSISTGNVTTFTWSSIPTDRLVFIRGCAVINSVKTCRHWAGAWYHGKYITDYGGNIYIQFFP